ncbi:unnamed protein product [Didymodactylos carnosus]|uniref:C2H2-type domain-containing protein n=1 Tax=Didymodactylos carnosus TaxID=1234261 RepID=A0A813QT84_9BILA|nr:unnamed protein product [Didymodactylos carnosus]CAF0770866.1 unnamed protein product [Didymodactylos carnosus]CAF3539894.1 unnamed protein product [Didymodactylos carnosus]CAF3552986.1 unnamed protein product [Didymodactylos carnosus]
MNSSSITTKSSPVNSNQPILTTTDEKTNEINENDHTLCHETTITTTTDFVIQQLSPSSIPPLTPRSDTASSSFIGGGGGDSFDLSPKSYAVIETGDATELEQIIDLLRQFFPNTKILEYNNNNRGSREQSSTPNSFGGSPSRSYLATNQQTSTDSLRVPDLHHRSSNNSSPKSSFESDVFNVDRHSSFGGYSSNLSDYSDKQNRSINSQGFKGKVKDYLQRRYLEQLEDRAQRKDTFTKCRSDDINYSVCRDERDVLLQISSSQKTSTSQQQRHELSSSHANISSFTNEPTVTFSPLNIKARSLDLTVPREHSVSDSTIHPSISRSYSKRRLERLVLTTVIAWITASVSDILSFRMITIDMEDAPNSNSYENGRELAKDRQMSSPPADCTKITFSIDQHFDPVEPSTDEVRENVITTNPTPILFTKLSNVRSARNLTVDDALQSDFHERTFRHPLQHSYSEQTSNKQGEHSPDCQQLDQSSILTSYRHQYPLSPTDTMDPRLKQLLPPQTHRIQPCSQIKQQSFDRILTPIVFPPLLRGPTTPFSAASDPGQYSSQTAPNPYTLVSFHFPKSQEPMAVNAQGSIAQLSNLTKILCDEQNVFTPISPRFKMEAQEPTTDQIPPCQICRQRFDSRQMYIAHYRSHLQSAVDDDKTAILEGDRVDSRSYQCKVCFKRFSRSDMLNRHLRLHSGIRPYRCTMCNTHFSRSDHLSTHLRTHTGEKPYACPECSYAACRRDMITRHLKVHSKQRKNATSSMGSSQDSVGSNG